MTRKSLIAVLAVAAATMGLGAAPAQGVATFTPTRFDDPAPGSCDPNDCSLREAILAANVTVGVPDQIILQAGTYQLSIPGSDEAEGLDGDLDVTNDPLAIAGQARDATIIDAGGTGTGERAFDVFSELSLDRMTVRNSVTTGSYAGIYGETGAGLTLTDVAVTGHQSGPAGCCAGVTTDGPATFVRILVTGNIAGTAGHAGLRHTTAPISITDSTIRDNLSNAFSSGVVAYSGADAVLDRVTVANNTAADGSGAGLSNGGGFGSMTARNVTVTGNTATEGSAGASNFDGTLTINNATVTGNTANSDNTGTGEDGAGLSNDSGSVNVSNSIVATNQVGAGSSGPDCSGAITSLGYNLLGTTDGCSYTAGAGDQIGAAPNLGPLADNGGLTPTIPLLPGSPAIDAGNPTIARAEGGPACEATDQRGLPRTDCDIGAYEQILCGKVLVNRFGTEGNDRVAGTSGADGILGLGGRDKLNGLSGKDALCGGKGKDKLKGGGGKDVLRGEQGKDTCVGGPGKDKAKCEEEKKI